MTAATGRFHDDDCPECGEAACVCREPREPITLDQIGCARCDGEGHPGITYQPFTFPIDFGDGSVATHWAPCPTNGEPILYVVVQKEEA